MENTQQRVELMREIRKKTAAYLPKQTELVENQKLILQQLAAVIPPVGICLARAERDYWPEVEKRVMDMTHAARLCAQDVSNIIRITVPANLPLDSHSEETLLKAWASLDYYGGKMDGSAAVKLRELYIALAEIIRKKEAEAAAEQARQEEAARLAAEEQARREEAARVAAQQSARKQIRDEDKTVMVQPEEPEARTDREVADESEDEGLTSVLVLDRSQETVVETILRKPEWTDVELPPQESEDIQPERKPETDAEESTGMLDQDLADMFREPVVPVNQTEKKLHLPRMAFVAGGIAVLAVLLVVIVSAVFSKPARMERQIGKLGSITLNSREDLEAAERAFDQLTDQQQKKVDNRITLELARMTYDCLVADQAIENIGNVTIESKEDIEAAEALFDALPEDARKNLRNAGTLTVARRTYDRIEQQVADTVAAIDAIGTVDLNSGDRIRAARKAYDDLGENNVAVAGQLKTLTDAETAFDQCMGQDLFDKAQAAAKAGKQEEALSQFLEIVNSYPKAPVAADAKQAAQDCRMVLADKASRKGDQYGAMQWIREMDASFTGTEEVRSLRESIEKKLEQARPRTGQKFVDKVGWGWNELGVTAPNEDVCVRIEDKSDPSKYMLVYIRAGEYQKIKIKDGEYRFYVTSGKYWYNKDVGFGFDATYRKGNEVLDLSTERSGRTVYYYVYSVNLGVPSKCWFTFTPTTEQDFWNT